MLRKAMLRMIMWGTISGLLIGAIVMAALGALAGGMAGIVGGASNGAVLGAIVGAFVGLVVTITNLALLLAEETRGWLQPDDHQVEQPPPPLAG
jgi:hypothetical protein